jgi:hypothetical protein
MATYTQYDSEGVQLAEDVEDTMWRDISPEETPVMTLAQQHSAGQKLTEWLQIEKRSAKSNKQIEGADSPAATGHTPTRLNNNQQIAEETAQVSDSQEEADNYGISSQMAEEIAFKTVELRTDVETAAVGAPGGTRQTGNVGAAGLAREMKALQNQLDISVTVAAGSGVTGGGGGTTPGNLLEADVLACHQGIRIKGGGKDLYLVHSIPAALDVARFVSPASGETSGRRRDLALSTTLVNAVEVYKTPWGTLTSVVDDFIDQNTAILLDSEYVAMKYLQPFKTKPLSEGGFYTKRGLLVETTIAALNTFASGYVDNINT